MQFFKFESAAAFWIARPVRVLPVNEMMRMSMCDDIAAPAAPCPERMLNTPGGKPALATSSAAFAHYVNYLASPGFSGEQLTVKGAFSLLFRTTVLPAASAAAPFFEKNISGAFHGMMIPQTP